MRTDTFLFFIGGIILIIGIAILTGGNLSGILIGILGILILITAKYYDKIKKYLIKNKSDVLLYFSALMFLTWIWTIQYGDICWIFFALFALGIALICFLKEEKIEEEDV